LTATVFALAALASARTPRDDPAYAAARVFVERCQNFTDDPVADEPLAADGGFFFIPGDAAQNKAGPAGVDRQGRPRFHAYGTMTADGLRALLRCGLPLEHPRVQAARGWLEQHFSATRNPGQFNPDREVLRNATYYYWAWSVAHAFLTLEVRELNTPQGRVRWTEVLAEELLRRQRPDGSWVNRFTDAKEDDPLIATSWAAAGLAICRALLLGRSETLADTCRARP
jgi:squalene-hopene/tetraprenyl-beta-curcumene cyclase